MDVTANYKKKKKKEETIEKESKSEKKTYDFNNTYMSNKMK